jgi:hypothetical protein
MNVKIKDRKLVIELDLQEATPSASGKTLVVAGTQGRWRTGENIEGKPLWIIANAFIYPATSSGAGEEKQEARGSQKKGPKVGLGNEESTGKPTNSKRRGSKQHADDADEDDDDN